MKLIHLTAKRYPGSTADHHYVENLARGFHEKLGKDFSFVVRDTPDTTLADIPLIHISIPAWMKRTVFFFFWIPWFWMSTFRSEGQKTVFFTNDQNILTLLILWKKLLCFHYEVAADWHMLSRSWRDGYIARNADVSITTSEKLERAVLRIAPWARASTVYGAVDLSPFEKLNNKDDLRRELGLPLDKFLVGYVGLFKTMEMEKGVGTMVDALAHLPADCAMVFVGEKNGEREEYGGAHERSIFVPVQSFEKVVAYEKAMDVLVIPYPDKPHFRDFGFPMKIYEYMASGVPIVYTKLELLEEVVGDSAYGIAPDSGKALATAVEHIRTHVSEAEGLARKAFEKVKNFTWTAKTRAMVEKFDIMTTMLNIPDNALAYILFQRTEFSIYATRRFLLRVVMNRRIPIYNLAVKLEAFLFRSRTKRLFSADMEREYGLIKDHLPVNPQNILDIGCGVAGIDIMLHKHYVAEGKRPHFYLLDKSEVNSKVYYGIEKEAAYYNSLAVAEKLLEANGVNKTNIHPQEVTGAPLFPGIQFDLIVSLISWGFHYPVSTYIDYVADALRPSGMLIIDVRKDTGGEALLEKKFGTFRIISEAQKYRRLLVIKK